MIYYLLVSSDTWFVNVFRYITFRSGCAAITALCIALFLGPRIIQKLKNLNPAGQPIRENGPANHLQTKKGTPTLGGLIIHLALFVSTLLWANLEDPYVWIVMFVTASLALLGFVDDYLKVVYRNSKGVSGKMKLLMQTIISLAACFAIQYVSTSNIQNFLTFPFFKTLALDLGYFYPVFVTVVIVGASNAVNLTDGLDGLVIVPIIIVSACFGIICYVVGNSIFASYLQLNYLSGTGELAVFCSALIGAGLGFLWYNAHPAQVFMGDTGSLALGGALGTISVITKHEFVLAITGGIFVIEAISVIVQVYYFKLSGGRRFFLMAPIHHHFEKKGWSETQVVVRFWILSVIFALLGMATLKLR